MQFYQEQKNCQKHLPMFDSVEILQLDSCQLLSYINIALLENPTLEYSEPAVVTLLNDLSVEYKEEGPGYSYRNPESESPEFADASILDYGEDLTSHLLLQMERLKLEAPLYDVVCGIIHALDDDGYLRVSLDDLTKPAQKELFHDAVRLVQSMDPPGVCARTLQECLCLQLRAMQIEGLPYRIAECYLEQASRHAFATISAKEHVSIHDIKEAYHCIQALSPRPCAEFCSTPDIGSIIPDVLIVKQDGRLSVTINKTYRPELRVNPFYMTLGNETEDPETKEYITKKISQAEWLIQCVKQREETLLRCCGEILRRQYAFFLSQGPLMPMTMNNIAMGIGIHVSTVSRAVSGRYIQTPQGIRQLRSLFSAKLSGGEVSSVTAQRAVAELVDVENKKKPLSDQQLSERLSIRGITISRRTVAKYRELLKIPPACSRRA